jgi:hypothetical protein
MSADQRKWLLIGGLFVVAAMVIYTQMGGSTPAATGPVQTPARAARPQARAAEAVAPSKPVRLEALDHARDEPNDAQRNPFRFQPKVVAPPPRPVMTSPPPPTSPVAPPVAAGPPPPPTIPLKFIGLVEKAGGFKVAVLTDGKVTMYGREGDIIDGRYRIMKIGTESIELTHADGRGRQTVRLTGQ